MNSTSSTNRSTDSLSKLFLLIAAAGLLPIALSYGAAPDQSLPWLFAIEVNSVNLVHIFRAVMGLYLALIVFWLLGACKNTIRLPALYSLTVFMFGLAMGRLLSLTLDGLAHWLLSVYLILELGFGAVGLWLIHHTVKDFDKKDYQQ